MGRHLELHFGATGDWAPEEVRVPRAEGVVDHQRAVGVGVVFGVGRVVRHAHVPDRSNLRCLPDVAVAQRRVAVLPGDDVPVRRNGGALVRVGVVGDPHRGQGRQVVNDDLAVARLQTEVVGWVACFSQPNIDYVMTIMLV